VVVMLPGIAAYVLYKNGHLPQLESGSKDGAYSAILAFLPHGLKGLSVAALTAAIVASLAGKANSISTIFTLDIYKKYLDKGADEKKQVWVGRIVIVVAMLLSLIFTWDDLLGIGGEGGFTFIQKYTGYISPGILAIFLLGLFWRRTTPLAALVGIILGFALSVFFNEYAVGIFGKETWLYSAFEYQKMNKNVIETVTEIPFLLTMGTTFIITVITMILISLTGPKINPRSYEIDSTMFKLSNRNIAMIAAILLIFSALYIKFW
jgi:solute:Na+ symporter, SSS family